MINLKNPEEVQIMKEGGTILAKVLKELAVAVEPGVTTKDLNKLAEELVFEFGVKSAFLNYNNFPASLCVSVNDEIVHGLPSDRKLEEGDLLKLDMGVLHKGFNTDSAVTVLVSNKSKIQRAFSKDYSQKLKLISVTKEALKTGIGKTEAGNTIGDIGSVIQEYVESRNLNVIRDLVGHGIGRKLHEEPQVPNCGKAGQGLKLEEGMVIAIEPMVVTGDWAIKETKDGFTIKTKDGGLAAHFEHTVAVTKKGPLILTE